MSGPEDPDKTDPDRPDEGEDEQVGRSSTRDPAKPAGPGGGPVHRKQKRKRRGKHGPASGSRGKRGDGPPRGPRSRRAARASSLPSGRVARRRESRRHLVFAAAGLLAVIATSLLLLVFGYARFRGPGSSAVEIEWPASLDPEQAAELLAESGLVRSASATALYFRASGGTADFVPGPHVLPRYASPHDLRAMLERSPSRSSVRIVIPEGFHRYDIADRLQRRGFGVMRLRNPRAGKVFHLFKATWPGPGEPPDDPFGPV